MISPKKEWLASGGDDKRIHVWKVADISTQSQESSAEAPIELSLSDPVTLIKFSWDGHWLAGVDTKGNILAWDMFDEKINNDTKPSFMFPTSGSQIYTLAFSPGGRWLASGGGDTNIRLWDMAKPNSKPITLTSNEKSIFALAFSPDGRWMVSGGSDNEIQIWGSSIAQLEEGACRTVGRNLDWQEWRSYFKNQEYHVTCPKNPFPASVADHFLFPGDQAARDGESEGAILAYPKALEQCPPVRCPGFKETFVNDPKSRATNALLDEGDKLAESGDINSAIQKYQIAFNLDTQDLFGYHP